MKNKDYIYYLELGKKHLKNKKFIFAFKSLKKALNIEPGNYEVLKEIGNIYYDKKLLDKALEYYNKSLKVKPNYYNALLNIANVHREKGDYKFSLELYENLESHTDKDDKLYICKGKFFSKLPKPDLNNALKNYIKALKLKPDNMLYNYFVGEAYLNKKKYKKAAEYIKKSIALYNGQDNTIALSLAYVYLAICYREGFNDFSSSTCFLKKALELNSNSPAVFIALLGADLAIKKDLNLSKKYLNKVLLKENNDDKSIAVFAHRALYLCHLEDKNYEAAIKQLNLAIKKFPENYFLYKDAANFYRKIKKDENLAIKYYKVAKYLEKIENNCKCSNIYLYIGIYFKDEKQLDLAAKYIEQYIEMKNDEPLAYYHMAEIYLGKKDYIQSLEYFKKSLKNNPKLLLNYKFNIACIESNQVEMGINILKKHLESDKNNPLLYYMIANLTAHKIYSSGQINSKQYLWSLKHNLCYNSL